MKLQPLETYRTPEFPTQEVIIRHPELLRALPRRWHNNPLVLGALAGLLALIEQSPARAEDKPTLRVAPIFEHGKGVGAFGCVAVSPPVFLTEAEAREVIENEARKEGVEFSDRDHTLDGVLLPVTDEFAFLDKVETSGKKQKSPKKTSQKGDLKLDGWNPRRRIGYKFVALKDFKAWETKEQMRDCSVSEYDMLDAAKRLQTGLSKVKETGAVAVFFEPAGKAPKDLKYPDLPTAEPKNGKALSKEEKEAREKAAQAAGEAYWKEHEKVAKKQGADELRKQVQDYLAWLKVQGVI